MALLSRLSPWSALSDLERQMDQLVKGVFGETGFDTPQRIAGRQAKAWMPAVDVFSRDSDLVIRAELAGVDPEKDVEITAEDGVLRIRGQRHYENRDEGANYFRMETSYGSFERSVPLPEGVNPDDIKAVHRNGVLEVVVPNAARIATARKIPVQIDEGQAQQQTIEAKPEEAPAGDQSAA
ncbi:MAG TPA: Hsp20/alpha crystallin family protein [Actinomycetota bacterium]|nr:Hsp20/alpha crystallin family protein [Actinomycetota bacterium]